MNVLSGLRMLSGRGGATTHQSYPAGVALAAQVPATQLSVERQQPVPHDLPGMQHVLSPAPSL